MTAAPDPALILAVAIDAARASAAILRQIWLAGDVAVHQHVHHDVKLDADVKSEAAIINIIRARRPHDGILAEESGAHAVGRDALWIVDPLDGSVNFSHCHPHFCISIAWAWKGEIIVGVVCDPLRNELFTAVKGAGSFLNGSPIHVAPTTVLNRAMIAIGFGKVEPETRLMPDMSKLAPFVQKIRIMGSAALDILYIACGRVDGYYEPEIFTWDIAAASIILAEAGGSAIMWPAAKPYQVRCLAGAPALLQPMADLLCLDTSIARPCTNLP